MTPDCPQVYGSPQTRPNSQLVRSGRTSTYTSINSCRVVVLSDGRRPQTTAKCLSALDERGGHPYQVFDGGRDGHASALWKVLRDHEFSHPWHDLLVVEDDVRVCRNALKYMAAFGVDALMGVVSFFDMRHLVGVYPQLLWVAGMAHDGVGFFGTQAVKFAWPMVKYLATHEPPHVSGDVAVSMLLDQAEEGWDLHAPSLVQHDDPRQTLNYVGDDFDAIRFAVKTRVPVKTVVFGEPNPTVADLLALIRA